MRKVGEYYYRPSGCHYRIYQCEYNDGTTFMGRPIYDEPYMFTEPEEARKRVYELNGWKYTPKKP